MKKVLLTRLDIENYRGQSRSVVFNEDVTRIYGRNKGGKSTIHNAFLQLMTRYDNKDDVNSEMFDTSIEHTYDNRKPVVITAWIDINGLEFEIKQTAEMGWTRAKGEDRYERGGGTKYRFYIDGIEKNATQYAAWIEENLAPMDKLKIMLNTEHFIGNITKWEERRKHLTDISGKIGRGDFKGNYSQLFKEMERYTIKELKERTKTYSKPLKDQIGTDKTRGSLDIEIDSMISNLPNYDEIEVAIKNEDTLASELKMLDDAIVDANLSVEPYKKKREDELKQIEILEDEIRKGEQKVRDNYNDEFSRLRIKMSSMQNDLRDAQSKHNSGMSENLQALMEQKSEAESENWRIKSRNTNIAAEVDSLRIKIHQTESLISQYNLDIEAKRKERDRIKALVFHAESCSYCGQELPYEKIEELKKLFNDNNEKLLIPITDRGVWLKRKIGELLESLPALKDSLSKLEESGLSKLISLEDIESKIKEEKEKQTPFEDTNIYISMKAEIDSLGLALSSPAPRFSSTTEYDSLKSQINELYLNLTEVPEVDIESVLEQKDAVLEKIKVNSEVIGLKKEWDRQINRIEEKKNLKKEVSIELARWEKVQQDISNYESEYAQIVQNRTNSLFSRVSIEMLEVNKGGDIKDTCVVLFNGVPHEVWNTAERILSGIDISRAFMTYYGLRLPLFIDGAESVNKENFYKTDNQMVYLFVSDEDKKLRIE